MIARPCLPAPAIDREAKAAPTELPHSTANRHGTPHD